MKLSEIISFFVVVSGISLVLTAICYVISLITGFENILQNFNIIFIIIFSSWLLFFIITENGTLRNFFYIRAASIKIVPVLDLLLSPLVLVSAFLLSFVRRKGVDRMRISRKIFFTIGVFPIIDHYYEPLFNTDGLVKQWKHKREIRGIDFNVGEQLMLLNKFHYNDELLEIPLEKPKGDLRFYYHNFAFEAGDAEFLYNMIRYFKPNRIVEIGSGFSTLMAREAIEQNKKEASSYKCEHVCIEPFESAWLESLGVKVIRKKVEEMDKSIFLTLDRNDILFIDSSHIIRPRGDVIREYLEILPILKSGVLIHIHDIWTPNDYPARWVINQIKFWNEQYLVEAFLIYNIEFKIVAALNYLKHHHFPDLARKCPILEKEPNLIGPASLWLIRN